MGNVLCISKPEADADNNSAGLKSKTHKVTKQVSELVKKRHVPNTTAVPAADAKDDSPAKLNTVLAAKQEQDDSCPITANEEVAEDDYMPDGPLLSLGQGGKPWDLLKQGIPSAPNDEDRWRNARALGISPNQPRCQELDVLLQTLAKVFDAPYTSLALYYNRCCWLANTSNMGDGRLPWCISACPWNTLVTQPQTIACGELQEDARFRHQPWVQGGLRCYCSAPLLASNGHRLGTICFMDSAPRKVDAGMCRVLNNFGEVAVRILERHLGLAQRLRAAQEALPPELSSLLSAAHTGRAMLERSQSRNMLLTGLKEGNWKRSDTNRLSRQTTSTQEPPKQLPSGVQPTEDDKVAVPKAPARTDSGRAGSRASSKEISPEDELLANMFARQLRNPTMLQDACVLLIDTGKPGWPVLWADDTWLLWAGYSRSELVGRNLQDVLRSAAPGVAPLNWDALQAEARAQERFVIPAVVAVPRGTGSHRSLQSAYKTDISDYALMPRGEGGKAYVKSGGVHDLDQTFPLSKPSDSQIAAPGQGSAEIPLQKSAASFKEYTSNSSLISAGNEGLLERVAQVESRQRADTESRRLQDAEAAGIQLHAAAGDFNSLVAPEGPITSHGSNTAIAMAAGAAQGGKVFDLSFRPMALDVLDGDTLPLGVPSWVPMEACEPVLRLYSVRLHEANRLPPPPQPLAPSLKVVCRKSSMLSQLVSHLFPGLSVGQVLGRGGYGTAYAGQWHDTKVVVKVQDYLLSTEDELRQAQLEVSLGQILRHSNLVRTLGHGSADIPQQEIVNPETFGAKASDNTPACLDPAVLHPLSRWLMESVPQWDDFGPDVWFSHCSKQDLRTRDLTDFVAPTLVDKLPAASSMINASCIAPDSLFAALNNNGNHTTKQLPVLEAITEEQAGLISKGKNTEGLGIPATEEGAAGVGDLIQATPAERFSNGCCQHTSTPSSKSSDMPPTPVAISVQSANSLGLGLNAKETSNNSWAEVKPTLPMAPKPNSAHSHASSHGSVMSLHASNICYVPVGYNINPPMTSNLDASPAHMLQMSGQLPDSLASQPSSNSAQLDNPYLTQFGPAPSSKFDLGMPSSTLTVKSDNSAVSLGAASMSEEVSTLLKNAQEHAARVNAAPLKFPLHLRALAIQEFCDGGTLLDAIDRGWIRAGACDQSSPPDLFKVIKLAQQIARGCAYLHSRGVVHADLSASNVLLCKARATVTPGSVASLGAGEAEKQCGPPSGKAKNDPELPGTMTYRLPIRQYTLASSTARKATEMEFVAKVADFGKACLLGPEGVYKAGGYATVTHMAPEVLRDQLLSPAADVYALGVLIWQMFTGSRPWAAMSHAQILGAVIAGVSQLEWTLLNATLPAYQLSIADGIIKLGQECMSYDASARPSMTQIDSFLDLLLAQLDRAAAQESPTSSTITNSSDTTASASVSKASIDVRPGC